MPGAGRRQPAGAAVAALTGAAVLVTMAVACGTVRAGQPGAVRMATGPVPAARASRQGPVAGSARQARRLADALLSRLVLPAAARPIGWHPLAALRQTEIALGVPQQADVRALWLVPEPMPELAGFIRAHPPAGLPFQGFSPGVRGFSQAGSGARILSETATLSVRSLPPGIQQAQLVLEIAPAGKDTSMLRADGEVIWYPPRSAAEYLAPGRWHAVTVTARFFFPAPHDARRTFTAPAVIAALARFLDGLRAAPGESMSCPNTAVTYTLAFASSAAARPSLLASTSECDSVQITVDGRSQPTLADPDGLIPRAAQAALAGHPGVLAPAPGPTTPLPLPAHP